MGLIEQIHHHRAEHLKPIENYTQSAYHLSIIEFRNLENKKGKI
jgi:hypothetical protein